MSLVVHYMFNEIVNGKIPDVSGNGNDFPISASSECYLVDNIVDPKTKEIYSENSYIMLYSDKKVFYPI